MKLQQLPVTRDRWVDAVKIFACLLVVLGHFFQSMFKSDIIPDTHLYGWFNQTIYYFHVPLFFICSGYLFQKRSSVTTLSEWKDNFLRKLISLAIPYAFFSLATYLMKVLFSDSVNKEAGNLFETLFLNPVSPYWYLYALIFIFLITPTISSKRGAAVFTVAALVMKGLSFIPGNNIYALRYILEDEIWFVTGMMLSYCDVPSCIEKVARKWAVLISALFIAVSAAVYLYTEWNDVVAFAMGIFGCVSVLIIMFKFEESNSLNKATVILSKYTFPVFLMHTIFAAGFRSVLFRFGIESSVVHIIFGLIISFLGPIIAAIIMSEIKFLEFLLYPSKYIRIGSKKK